MKQLLATGAIVLLTVGGAVAQESAKGGGQAAGSVAQVLTDMEHQWAKASKAGDGDALAPLLSDDFVAIDSDGSMHTKADVVARTKKAKWVTNENRRPQGHGAWRFSGCDRVLTGNGTDAAGKAVNAKERWADTWVKTTGGTWQCVASARRRSSRFLPYPPLVAT